MQTKLRIFLYISLFCIALTSYAQEANFTMSTAGSGCGILQISFQNTSVGADAVSWDFGNGNTATINDPIAVYSTPGTYTITLTVTAGPATGLTKSEEITLNPLPVIQNMTVNPTNGCFGETYQFEADINSQATGGIVSYFWNFGDGTFSRDERPSHIYEGAGIYDVTLVVEDANDCVISQTFPAMVSVGEGVLVDITSSAPLVYCSVPQTIDFSADVPAGDYAFEWLLDGVQISTDSTITQTFATMQDDAYVLELRVTDDSLGCTVSRQLDVRLRPAVAGFTAEETEGCEPFTVNFEEDIQHIVDSATTTVTWDFGDGNSMSGLLSDEEFRTPSHTYAIPGSYTVSMQVIDNTNSCTDFVSVSDYITVHENVAIDFTADETSFCQNNQTVQFNSLVTDADSLIWNFGDGSFLRGNASEPSVLNPSHTYAFYGSFDVTLTVFTTTSCETTITKENYINLAELNANINVAPNALCVPLDFQSDSQLLIGGCAPYQVQLFDGSRAVVPLTYDWQVTGTDSDGNPFTFNSTEQNPQVVFPEAGNYFVSLNISADGGCTSSTTLADTIKVGISPSSLDFSTDAPSEICNGETVNFTNESVLDIDNPYPVFTYWDFIQSDSTMDGGSGLTNGVYVYDNQNPSTQNAKLWYFSNGCWECIEKEVTEIKMPKAGAELYTPICAEGDSVYFINRSVMTSNATLNWTFTVQETGDVYMFTDEYVGIPLTTGQTVNWELEVSDPYDPTNPLTKNPDGCTDTISGSYTKPNSVAPNFENAVLFSQTDGDACAPNTYSITSNIAISGTQITEYAWDFGNGESQISNSNTATITYDTPGNYSIRLKIKTASGCEFEHVYNDQITVGGVTANFDYCPAGTCLDSAVTFYDNSVSVAEIQEWEFNFGDGNTTVITNSDDFPFEYSYTDSVDYTSPLGNPYPQQDFYTVSMKVTDVNGCVDSTSMIIRPTRPVPEAKQPFDLEYICENDVKGAMVNFEVEQDSTHGLLPLFGLFYVDGDPDMDFFNIGTWATGPKFYEGNDPARQYTGTVMVFDQNNCPNTSSFTFEVAKDTIIADFSVDNGSSNCIPLEATFIADAFLDSDILESQGLNGIASYTWSFGDGIVITDSVPTTTYNYTIPNTEGYDVSLTVTDSLGCTVTILKEKYIKVGGPDGDYRIDREIGYAPLTVNFEGFPIPTNEDFSFLWDFGDGTTGLGVRDASITDSLLYRTQHTYTAPGIYNPTLVLSDSIGCTLSPQVTRQIEVLACPELAIIDTTFCQGDGDYTLNLLLDSIQLGTANVSWFIDGAEQGAFANQTEVVFPEQLGVRTIRVVFDIEHDGNTYCATDSSFTLTYESSPNTAFTLSETTICLLENGTSEPLILTDVSTHPDGLTLTNLNYFIFRQFDGATVTTFTGNIGGDTSFDGFTEPGVYEVLATIQSEQGCETFSNVQEVTVTPQPNVNIQSQNLCEGLTSDFTATASFPAGVTGITVTSFVWDFENDGNIESTGENVSFTFPTQGEYVNRLIVTTSEGCTLEMLDTVQIFPVAVATVGTNFTVCEGEALEIPISAVIDNSIINTASVVSFEWNMGDGSTAITSPANTNGEATLNYTYASIGNYTASVQVLSASGCLSDPINITIAVEPTPIPAFEIAEVCFISEGNVRVIFDASNTTGPVTNYHWDFESDGTTNRSVNVDTIHHIFSTTGSQFVQLITENNGCADTITQEIEIPSVDFGVEFSSCNPLTVIFTAVDDGLIGKSGFSYDWLIDGTNYTGEEVSVTFDASQNNTTISAMLTIGFTTASNPTDCGTPYSITKPIDLDADLSQLREEILPATPDPFIACVGDPLALSGVGIDINGNEVISYSWDHYLQSDNSGQGVIDANTQDAEFIFTTAGTYTIELVMQTIDPSCNLTVSRTIQVFEKPSPILTADTEICEGETLELFSTGSTWDVANNPVTFRWYKTDGSLTLLNESSSATEVSHVVTNNLSVGFHNFYLEIDDGNCATQSDTLEIEVKANPIASFNVIQQCEGDSILIENTSTLTPDTPHTYQWTVNDATTTTVFTSTDENLTIPTSLSSGSYEVILTVSSASCLNTHTQFIQVTPKPIADFSTDNPLCAESAVTFTNQTTYAGSDDLTYLWTFGDGSSSTLPNPLPKVYTNAGSYTVSLLVSSDSCSDGVQRVIEIQERPTVSIDASFEPVCGDAFLTINPREAENNAELSYFWEIESSTGGTITADAFNNYQIVLRAENITADQAEATLSLYVQSDITGCISDTVQTTVIFRGLPIAEADLGEDISVCENENPLIGKVASSADYSYSWRVISQSGENPSTVQIDFVNMNTAELQISQAIYNPNNLTSGSAILLLERVVTDETFSGNTQFSQCQASDTLEVTITLTPDLVYNNTYEACAGEELLILPDADARYNFYEYSWSVIGNNASSFTIEEGDNPYEARVLLNADSSLLQQANISSSVEVIATLGNCTVRDTIPINFLGNPLYAFPSTYDFCALEQPSFAVNMNLSTSEYLLTWDELDNNGNIVRTTTGTTLNPEQGGGVYRVTASVTSTGCEFEYIVTVIDRCAPQVAYPNAFTPNGDGKSDGFRIKEQYASDFLLKIYDRWGVVVFETNDSAVAWDGTYNGKEMPQGVYTYKVEYIDEINNEEVVNFGSITLLR